MRLKIGCETKNRVFIPYNYHYKLHAALYKIMQKSSIEFSKFLHDTGFIDPITNKPMKLFSFSKIFFNSAHRTKNGFENVRSFTFYFSTPIEPSLENLVLGIFSDQNLQLNFQGKNHNFEITKVESLPDPNYSSEMTFTCLSPITTTISTESLKSHGLDYMKPEERQKFVQNIHQNLLKKYRIIHQKEFAGQNDFQFKFDPQYIIKRQGKISKLISFKQNLKIKAMEAPFTIKADPALIKIGYDCGFGEKNSAGFGLVDLVKKEKWEKMIDA
jgi:CRISPR-associated endoribonuclease Cas6